MICAREARWYATMAGLVVVLAPGSIMHTCTLLTTSGTAYLTALKPRDVRVVVLAFLGGLMLRFGLCVLCLLHPLLCRLPGCLGALVFQQINEGARVDMKHTIAFSLHFFLCKCNETCMTSLVVLTFEVYVHALVVFQDQDGT